MKDPNEDDEVRRWSASGLSQVCQKSKDKELLKLFFQIIEDPSDDETIKDSLLSSALCIYGLSSKEQFDRNITVLPSLEEMFITFKKEIAEIQRIIE